MKRLLIAAALACVLFAIAPSAPAQGTGSGTATWSYTAPTTYTDGSSIASGTSVTYNLYVGTAGAGSEAATPLQTGITALTVTTTGYSAGQTVCGEVTAVVNGVESAKSNEACKSFPLVPSAPSALTVK
jgi:hypothetical protein